jgi:hypothetical protein
MEKEKRYFAIGDDYRDDFVLFAKAILALGKVGEKAFIVINSTGGNIGSQPFPKREPIIIKKLPELCEPFIPKLKDLKKPHQNRYAQRSARMKQW